MKRSQNQLNLLLAISGVATLAVGILALTGWIFGLRSLASISSDYIPMAPATALLSAGFGLILLSVAYKVDKGIGRSLTVGAVCLFSLYAFLKFFGYLVKTDLTFDSFFFPVTQFLGRVPINRSSPVTGLLFFLCGVATLVKILGRERLSELNLISGLGLIVGCTGFTGFMGYLFGTPFLYGGDVRPLSLLTTIVFLLLGCGLVAMGGTRTIILRHLVGPSASASILRAILPLIVIVLLADSFSSRLLAHIPTINHVLTSAIFGLLLIPLTILIVIKVSRTIFHSAEKAEDARRLAEAELKESERRFKSLVNTLGEGIALVDPEEHILLANPSAEQIFGVPPGSLTGRTLKDFLLPDQVSKVLMETKKRAHGEQSTYELDIITPDNLVRNILVTATPQVSIEGVIVGTFGVFRDISEQKKADSELAKFAKDLKESNATKDKFFSIIAHDLKSPFNSILGLTNLLATDFYAMDQRNIENTLTAIKNSSEGAFELLENLLIWANSQTGHLQFNPGKIHLQKIIHENILLVACQATGKNIRIVSSCKEEYIAFGDHQMVQTVLRNLISNSIKFTPQGGEIVIAVAPADSHYEISVKDTGTGIAAENIPKLFKIDSKYSTVGTANEKGTGLGLILCKEFVEINGGTIWVESEVGKGSKFAFTLPCDLP